jgi:PAS domain S-box-containing protein
MAFALDKSPVHQDRAGSIAASLKMAEGSSAAPNVPTAFSEISPDILTDALLQAAHRAGLGIVVTARKGDAFKTVFANSEAAAQLGYPVEEIRQLDVGSRVAPEDLQRFLAFSTALRSGQPVEMPIGLKIQRKDGAVREIELSCATVRAPGDLLVVTFTREVTERNSAQRKAAEVDIAFKGYLERAADAVVISRGGKVLWSNSVAARQLAYESPEALFGADLFSMLGPDEQRELGTRVKAVMETGQPSAPLEYNVRRKDGTVARVEGSSVRIEWDGQPALFSVVRDIGDRAEKLAQLAQTDRLAALGTLAAGLAHEINNPMAAVLFAVEGISRVLGRVSAREPAVLEAVRVLDELRTSAERMARIVRELRTFSRGGDERLEPIDLRAVLEGAEVITGRAVGDAARLEVNLTGAPKVLANAGRLEQVVVNLIINAVQAMPPDRPAKENRIEVRFERSPQWVVLAVKDNGVGIPPELLGRIFEPFFTTKPVGIGTGLGLSICHGLVKQLGGELEVDSTVGVGTTVRVCLKPADS